MRRKLFYKIITILILIFIVIPFKVFSEDVNILQEIPYQLLELRDKYEYYVDYNVIGSLNSGNFTMEFLIKDSDGKIADINDNLYFSLSQVAQEGVEAGNLPDGDDGLVIKNGKGSWKFNAKYSKDMINGTMDEGFILNITSKNAVGLLLDFGNLGAVLDPGDYISELIPRDKNAKKITKVKKVNTTNNKDGEVIDSSDYKFDNHIVAEKIYSDNDNIYTEYSKEKYTELEKKYVNSGEFLGRIYFSKEGFYGNTVEQREKDSILLDKKFLKIVNKNNNVLVSYPKKNIIKIIEEKNIKDPKEFYIYSIIFPQLAWKHSDAIIFSLIYGNKTAKDFEFEMGDNFEESKSNFQEEFPNFYEINGPVSYLDPDNFLILNTNTIDNSKYNKYEIEGEYYKVPIEKELLKDILYDTIFNGLNPFFNNLEEYVDSEITFERKNNMYYAHLNNKENINDIRLFFDESTMRTSCETLNSEGENIIECNTTNILAKKKKSIATFSTSIQGGKIDDYIEDNGSTINISKLIKNNTGKDLTKSTILGIGLVINNKNFSNYILFGQKGLFSFASTIAGPANISKNPVLIGINSIVTLLYIIIFSLVGNYINVLFGEKLVVLNINKKLSVKTKQNSVLVRKKIEGIIEQTGIIEYSYMKIIIRHIWIFFARHGGKIIFIFTIILVGIISQISIDDFNIFTLNSSFMIIIGLICIGLISFIKEFIYLIFTKNIMKFEIEYIPIGFIILLLIAIVVRIFAIVPGILFGQSFRLIKISKNFFLNFLESTVFFYSLLITYSIALILWFSTIFLPPDSFLSNFLLFGYFSITNDVFFSLIPFGMFWGAKILEHKKLKIPYYVLFFITMFGLLHTIYNPKGDFSKLDNVNGNMFLFVIGIGIGLLILLFLYIYDKITNKLEYNN